MTSQIFDAQRPSSELRRTSSWLIIPGLLICCMAARAAAASPAAETRRIDVGGYMLTLKTQGRGAPTVVIDAGLGEPAVESNQWNTVVDAIAKTNLVCVYDRAGLGTSDAAPKKPRTSRDIARDLHTLLANAHVPGQYILVGQSIGGLNVRVFAGMYPRDVAGMVLVDSTCPGQDRRWLDALSATRPGEDPGITKARDFLTSRLAKPMDNPEALDVVASMEQARAAGSLGNKPLAVLTHSPNSGWRRIAPDLPDDVSAKLEKITQDLQNDLAKLSTSSTHTIATKAGHQIQVDESELVIAAIREVAGKAGAAR